MILYVIQLVLGLAIHILKTPSLFGGRRPPQNYFHVVLGIAILALAAYNVLEIHFTLSTTSLTYFQVHYGLYTEWLLLGGLHQMPVAAEHAWLALVVVSVSISLN
jgi:hypothetical protein